jgi:RNA polymerase sigma factor (TIGR02999 family)
MTADTQTVSRLLSELPHRPGAANELLPLVYDQLRAIAMQRMREERAGHTLQATALVHEAYLRLARGFDNADGGEWEGRAHFFRVAADAMRKILIDHARRRKAEKRGGGVRPASLDAAEEAQAISIDSDPESLIALDEALQSLAAEDARAAEVVQLRFFSGLGFADIAKLLGVSERTILREWAFARARLVQLIEGRRDAPPTDDYDGGAFAHA